ncbi:UNVERIFIED_ORG: transcriptional regulator with XRE-family HTH domain [Bacillus sp. B2I3]|nr:transcriptional regulator with XRE-family HTH domain [Bacillus sp. B2I3]
MGTKYVLRSHLKELMETCRNGEGISANELANFIDERRSTLNDLINNKDMETRRIPARLFAKLCVFFKVTPSELFSVVVIHEDEGVERRIEQVLKDRRK